MAIFRKFKKYSGKNRRSVAKKPTIKKAIRKVRTAAFRKKVLSVIHKVAEDKHAATSVISRVISDAPNTTDMFQLIPNITAGTGDNNRVGDSINARSLRLKLIIDHLPPVTPNSAAHLYYGIRVMIVQPRQFRGLSQIQSNADTWLSNLLRDGGTKTAFAQNNPKSMLLPINSDEIITYYDKCYYETFPEVYQSTTAPTSYIYQTEWLKYGHKEISLALKVGKKMLKYDSSVNSGLTPTNYNPVLIIGVCSMQSTTQSGSNCMVSYHSQLTYEDL